MNKNLYRFLVIMAVILAIFCGFIFNEAIRLKRNPTALPWIVTDQTKYCVSCIEKGEELEMEYYSIGFKVKMKYYLSDESTEDNKIIGVSYKEFLLFNKYRLWAWIS